MATRKCLKNVPKQRPGYVVCFCVSGRLSLGKALDSNVSENGPLLMPSKLPSSMSVRCPQPPLAAKTGPTCARRASLVCEETSEPGSGLAAGHCGKSRPRCPFSPSSAVISSCWARPNRLSSFLAFLAFPRPIQSRLSSSLLTRYPSTFKFDSFCTIPSFVSKGQRFRLQRALDLSPGCLHNPESDHCSSAARNLGESAAS